jgi:MFS family permease
MNDGIKTRWSVVSIAVLAGVIVSMQAGKGPPVLGILREEFDLSLTLAGWVLSTVNVTGAVIGLLAGSISDRVGHRPTISLSLMFIVAGSLLGAVSPNVELLLFSRVLESIGFVGVVVSIPSIFMRVISPGDQRLVFGIWAGYMPFGMAVMMAASPALLTVTDWRGIWVFNAVITVLLLLVFRHMTRDLAPRTDNRAQVRIMSAMIRVLSVPGPWLLAGCFAAYAGQWAGMMAWLPTFLIEISGNDIAAAAWLTALVVVVNVPGNLIAGWLLHRGSTRWHLVALGSLCMAGTGYGVFADGVPDVARIIFAIAFSFAGGLVPTTLLSGAIIHSPEPALTATTNGVIINGANTGTLLGPPVVGALVGAIGGWQASGLAVAIGGGLALVFAILLGLVEKRMDSD